MRKLTQNEIKQIKQISDVVQKKNIIQDLIIKEWWKTKIGALQLFTGFGKSIVLSKIISKINIEFSSYTITIIVPTIKLKQDFEDRIVEFNLKNVKVFTLQSYSKLLKENNISTDFLVVDECHTILNENSMFFSEVLPKTNYKFVCCCSATLEYNHLKFLKQSDIEIVFDLSIEEGYLMSLVPDFSTYCVGVNLTEKEKLEYIKIQKEYDNCIQFFSRYDVNSPISAIISVSKGKSKCKYEGIECTGNEHAKRIGEKLEIPPGSVIGVAMRWMGLTNKRSTLLNHSENLIKGSLYILQHIKNKAIVFCSSKENVKYMSTQLKNSLPYHSGISDKKRKENLLKFEEGDTQYLLVIKGLDMGYNFEKLKIGLQFNYTSKKLQFSQRFGRFARFDKDDVTKEVLFICLYVNDFEKDGVKYLSSQKKWLQNSLKGRSFVEWGTIQELKQLLT